MTTIDLVPSVESDPVTADSMRAAMGAFCSGVVVVTALGIAPRSAPVGFTCQSFVSLSLDPPLVSISPARTSSTWPRIREVGRFAINVLAHDHAHLSNGFARSGADKFQGVDWRLSPGGAPVLDGVSAWVDCLLWDEYDGGDHTIVVGRVTALGHDASRGPLLYHRGSYAQSEWWAS